jgi:ATP-dependent DNA helicase 2 subunit 1
MATSALAFHYAQLEATAFREEFDVASFQDHTLPKNNTIHKKAGPLIKEWAKLLQSDESANAVIVETGSKRKAVSLRSSLGLQGYLLYGENDG